jgi:hypothetical protein
METLDTSQNLAYDSLTGITGIKCKKVYTASVEFKTEVDEKFSGNEQRYDRWSLPRRGWVLEFEKTPDITREMDAFFCRHRGKKKAFNWKWDAVVDNEDFGGNDVIYKVRFDIDKLDFSMMEMGYSTFSVPIVQLFNEE